MDSKRLRHDDEEQEEKQEDDDDDDDGEEDNDDEDDEEGYDDDDAYRWRCSPFNRRFLRLLKRLRAEKKCALALELGFAVDGQLVMTNGLPGVVIRAPTTKTTPVAEDNKQPPNLNLSLPISVSTLNTLISNYTTLAPFGMGTETVVDPTVRMTHSMEAAMIAFQNPAWDAAILDLCRTKLTSQFGMEFPFHAELYKALIYSPGSHFKPHKDTVKTPGMFGTLVIALPVEEPCKGGTLVIQRNDANHTTKSFDMCPLPYSGIEYVAFFADCTHEVTMVTSGYRFSLIYNLVVDATAASSTTPLPTSVSTSATREKMSKFLEEKWSQENKSYLLLPIEHYYTPASFKGSESPHTVLKGVDLLDFKILHELNMEIAIVEMHKHLSGRDDGYDRGELDENNAFVDWGVEGATIPLTRSSECIALCDTLFGEDKSLSLDVIASRTDPCKDDDPYFTHSQPTGNEGMEIEQWYNKYALVIWPAKFSKRILLGLLPRHERLAVLRAWRAKSRGVTHKGVTYTVEDLDAIAAGLLREGDLNIVDFTTLCDYAGKRGDVEMVRKIAGIVRITHLISPSGMWSTLLSSSARVGLSCATLAEVLKPMLARFPSTPRDAEFTGVPSFTFLLDTLPSSLEVGVNDEESKKYRGELRTLIYEDPAFLEGWIKAMGETAKLYTAHLPVMVARLLLLLSQANNCKEESERKTKQLGALDPIAVISRLMTSIALQTVTDGHAIAQAVTHMLTADEPKLDPILKTFCDALGTSTNITVLEEVSRAIQTSPPRTRYALLEAPLLRNLLLQLEQRLGPRPSTDIPAAISAAQTALRNGKWNFRCCGCCNQVGEFLVSTEGNDRFNLHLRAAYRKHLQSRLSGVQKIVGHVASVTEGRMMFSLTRKDGLANAIANRRKIPGWESERDKVEGVRRRLREVEGELTTTTSATSGSGGEWGN